MSKLITARMIRAKGSCYNPTELKGIDSKTKWTLLEWMNYKHYMYGTDDAIWVFSQMADERMAREFAIWCVRRCKSRSKKINDYIDKIEGYYLNGTSIEEMEAADVAANRAANVAADWARSRADERKVQLAKIKRMLQKGKEQNEKRV